MDSLNLEVEDFFNDAYRNPIDNDLGIADELNMEEDKVLTDLEKLEKGAKKKQVKRPQPKLDLERLKSGKGLTALAGIFKDVKFKGKGHEYADLNTLMLMNQHWAHRLMPNVTFPEFIEKLEKLGTKKDTQTLIKRIRLDLIGSEGREINYGDLNQSDDENRNTSNTPNLDAIFGPSDHGNDTPSNHDDYTPNNDAPSSRLSQSTDGNILNTRGRNSNSRDTNSDNNNDLVNRGINEVIGSGGSNGDVLQKIVRNDGVTDGVIRDVDIEETVINKIERNRLLALEKRVQRLSRGGAL